MFCLVDRARAIPRLLIVAAALAAGLPVTFSHAGPERSASAGKLQVAYAATLLGIPIGHIDWTIELKDDRFSAAATGETAGLLSIFSRGRGFAQAAGSLEGREPHPFSFAVHYTHGSNAQKIKILFSGGHARESFVPPPLPNPTLVPLTEAYRAGVVDPMTALILRLPGTGSTVVPAACEPKIAVFDGRMRYDLRLEYKRLEQVRAAVGYQGPAVVCAVYFDPLAGYDPSRSAIKYLQAERGMEIWFAPLGGSRLLVPFRVSVPTPIGLGVLQAVRFIWTPRS
jgi:Protein of unknown function (DUF3108)